MVTLYSLKINWDISSEMVRKNIALVNNFLFYLHAQVIPFFLNNLFVFPSTKIFLLKFKTYNIFKQLRNA